MIENKSVIENIISCMYRDRTYYWTVYISGQRRVVDYRSAIAMISGFLVDISGSYNLPFAVCGGLQAIGGALSLSTMLVSRHMEKRNGEDTKKACDDMEADRDRYIHKVDSTIASVISVV